MRIVVSESIVTIDLSERGYYLGTVRKVAREQWGGLCGISMGEGREREREEKCWGGFVRERRCLRLAVRRM